jgi:hypothetical protein
MVVTVTRDTGSLSSEAKFSRTGRFLPAGFTVDAIPPPDLGAAVRRARLRVRLVARRHTSCSTGQWLDGRDGWQRGTVARRGASARVPAGCVKFSESQLTVVAYTRPRSTRASPQAAAARPSRLFRPSCRRTLRLEKLHLDCASSAPSHHESTQQWPLLHRKDYLQGFPPAGSCRLRPMPARGPEQPRRRRWRRSPGQPREC